MCKLVLDMQPFFEYSKKRELIRLDKEAGKSKPWTDDPVLLDFSFCNIFREHDKTTIWFRENLRDVVRDSREALFVTAVFRSYNRISTGELLKSLLLDLPKTYEIFADEAKRRLDGVVPTVTGAYVVRAKNGHPKRTSLIDHVVNQLWQVYPDPDSLQNIHAMVKRCDFIGDFVAYEFVTDLRHTYLCENAVDINTWASAGPGAARGLARMAGERLNLFNHQLASHQHKMLELMREVLQASRSFWPAEWGKWEMREVEHTLCEFDKYERLRQGQGRTKTIYRGRK